MILSSVFQERYAATRDAFERLEKECVPLLTKAAREFDGVFEGRHKEAESLFSKIEEGSYEHPFAEITDIYAATIALPDVSRIPHIRARVWDDFEELDSKWHRSSNPFEFIYDDLHLIIRLKPNVQILDKSLSDLKFELQIKSLLQFAWTKATHGIYKSRDVSWQRDGLAAEARAMLELLDGLLADVSRAASFQHERENADYARRRQIVALLATNWSSEQRPSDLRRCAVTIDNLLRLAKKSVDDLKGLMVGGVGQKYALARSLTPVQAVLVSLLTSMRPAQRNEFYDRAREQEIRFLVTQEMLGLVPRLEDVPMEVRVVM